MTAANPPTSLHYDVFLCHNSRDKEMVRDVADFLQVEAGVKFFLDRYSIPASVQFATFIDEELRRSASCAIFLGPSGWGETHLREARIALGLGQSEPVFRIIPVVMPGGRAEDWASLFGDGKTPPYNWVTFTTLDDVEAREKLLRAVRGDLAPRAAGPEEVTPYYIRRQAALWEKSHRTEGSLLLRGKLLRLAESTAAQSAALVGANAIPFLAASTKAERRRTQFRAGGIAAVGLSALLTAFGGYLETLRVAEATKREAEATKREAAAITEKQAALKQAKDELDQRLQIASGDAADHSLRATAGGDATTGMLLAIEAADSVADAGGPSLRLRRALYTALSENREIGWATREVKPTAINLRRGLIASWDQLGGINVMSADGVTRKLPLQIDKRPDTIAFDESGKALLTQHGREIRVWALGEGVTAQTIVAAWTIFAPRFCGPNVIAQPSFGGLNLTIWRGGAATELQDTGFGGAYLCTPDGAHVVAYSSSVRVADAETGRTITIEDALPNIPPQISADSRRMLSESREVGSLVLTELSTGKSTNVDLDQQRLAAWALGAKGEIAAATENGYLAFWGADGKLKFKVEMNGISALAIDHNGQKIVIGDDAGRIRIASSADGQTIRTLATGLKRIASVGLGLPPDDDEPESDVYARTNDGTIVVYDLSQASGHEPRMTFKSEFGKLESVLLGPQMLVANYADNRDGQIFDPWVAWNRSPGASFPNPLLQAVSPDGAFAAKVYNGRRVEIIRTSDGAIVSRVAAKHLGDIKTAFVTGPLLKLAAVYDGVLRVIDVASGVEQASAPLSAGRIVALAASDDGRYAATRLEGGEISVWSLRPLQVLHRFNASGDLLGSLTFAHHRDWLAVPSGQHVSIRELAGGTQVADINLLATGVFPKSKDPALAALNELSNKSAHFMDVSFSHDDTRLAASYNDGVIEWKTNDWTEIASAKSSTNNYRDVSYLPPDDQILLLGGVAFDPNTLTDFLSPSQTAPIPLSPFFDAAGAINISTTAAGTLKVREFPTQMRAMIDFARRRAPRCLTPEQRRIYDLDDMVPEWCTRLKKWPFGLSR